MNMNRRCCSDERKFKKESIDSFTKATSKSSEDVVPEWKRQLQFRMRKEAGNNG